MKKTGSGSMNTILKLGLVLGGGYVLMRYTGMKLPFVSAAVIPPAGDPPATSPTTPKQPGDTPPPATNVVTDAIIKRAAGGDAEAVKLADAAKVMFNSDEWNWYREQETGQATTTDLFPADNRGYKMLASEYVQRRVTAGLGELIMGRRSGWA